MKRVFLSLPMSGRTDEDIWKQIEQMTKSIESHHYDWKITHNMLTEPELDLFDLMEDIKHKPLLYLAAAITRMSQCDCILFGTGWEWARGCRIEAQVAKEYGLEMYYMDGNVIVNARRETEEV